MKLTTITLPAIEMSQEEENQLWFTPMSERVVLGKKVLMWHTSDGDNDILLEGETIFRKVLITGKL